MGDSGIIGLILQLGADTSGANEAIEDFAKRTGQSVGIVEAQIRDYRRAESAAYDEAVQRSRGAADDLDKSLLSSHQSVHLLAEEMGIHLPRAVVGAVSEMLPAISGLGGAMLAAFAVQKVIEFSGQLRNLADTWGGYSAAVKQGLEDDVKASDEALTHFQGLTTQLKIAAGEFLISQTELRIVENEAQKQALLDSQTGIKTLAELSLAAVSFGASLVPLIKNKYELNQATSHETELNTLLRKQLEALGVLEAAYNQEKIRGAKDGERAQREAQEAWERATEQQYEYFAARRKQAEEAAKEDFEYYVHLAEEINRLRDRNSELKQAITFSLQLAQVETQRKNDLSIEEEMHKRLDTQVKLLLEHSKELRAEWDRMHPTAARMREELQLLGIDTQQLSARQLEFIGVENQVVGALDKELAAYGFKAKAMKGFLAEELRELASFLTKKAHFKAMEQVAEALSDWPNFVAMGEHFAAAAAWEALGAGISGLAGAGAGALGGGRLGTDYRSSGSSGSHRESGRDDSYLPPQTLALGAASQGGRFGSPGSGIIVVHGSADLHQWVAGLVNGAVDRGITVTATSSQRGAPVGH